LPAAANDLAPGSVRITTRALPGGALTPNAFAPEPVSLGRPLSRIPRAFTPIERLAPIALRGFGRYAIRAIPYIGIAVTAYDVYNLAKPFWTISPPGPDEYPHGGLWKRTYGPFYYTDGSGYGNAKPLMHATAIYTAPITGQAISGVQPIATPVPASRNQTGLWRERWISVGGSGYYRYAHHSSWVRVGHVSGADNVQSVVSEAPIAPLPEWVDPFSRTPGARPVPGATPYRLIPYQGMNPYRSPHEQTQRGNAPPAAARRWGTPPMYPVEIVNVISTPGGPTGVYQRPSKPKPPRKGELQRKFDPGGRFRPGLNLVVGGVTETLDVVNALWKALPKENKTGYYLRHYKDEKTGEVKTYMKYLHPASQADKLRDLAQGFFKLDGEKAVSNLIDNQIEDAAFGRLGNALKKARGKQYFDESARFNKDRMAMGRRFRQLVKPRKQSHWIDLGPPGRGFQSGSGFHKF